ncbi:hypothetical protein F4703DRAFT_1866231 [Phycomyces blakesleeanus]
MIGMVYILIGVDLFIKSFLSTVVGRGSSWQSCEDEGDMVLPRVLLVALVFLFFLVVSEVVVHLIRSEAFAHSRMHLSSCWSRMCFNSRSLEREIHSPSLSW